MRGDIHRLRAPRGTRGHEQTGQRFAVVLQSDWVPLSTVLVAPTSTSANPTRFRPRIKVRDEVTQVQIEQTITVDSRRLGDRIGRVTYAELEEIETAITLMYDLRFPRVTG